MNLSCERSSSGTRDMMDCGKTYLDQLADRFSTSYSDPFGLGLVSGGGNRSPVFYLNSSGGMGSPSQTRSVREFEEQMAALRKENFNLKLRIYFLEEKMPELYRMKTPEGQDSIMQQYVESKVETGVLQKDLEDKQQLLLEAAEAITHMENMQKETEIKYQQIIDELSQKIQCLEFENESLENCTAKDETNMNELMGRTDLENNKLDLMQKIRELEGSVQEAENKITELSLQNRTLEQAVQSKDEMIKSFEQNIKEIEYEKNELNEKLEEKKKTTKAIETQMNKIQLEVEELRSKELIMNNLEDIIDMIRYENQQLKNEAETRRAVAEKYLETIRNQKNTIDEIRTNLDAKLSETACLTERLRCAEKNHAQQRKRYQTEIVRLRTAIKQEKNRCKKEKAENAKSNQTTEYDICPPKQSQHIDDLKLKEKVSIYFNNICSEQNHVNHNAAAISDLKRKIQLNIKSPWRMPIDGPESAFDLTSIRTPLPPLKFARGNPASSYCTQSTGGRSTKSESCLINYSNCFHNVFVLCSSASSVSVAQSNSSNFLPQCNTNSKSSSINALLTRPVSGEPQVRDHCQIHANECFATKLVRDLKVSRKLWPASRTI